MLGLVLGLAAMPVAASCQSAPLGNGKAFFYSPSGIGACSIPLTESDLSVAVSTALFQGSAMCGRCLQVTGPLGTITVPVTNECPTCDANDLDFTPLAFEAIGTPANGVEQVTWQTVECPVAGSMNYLFQASNPFFLSLLIRNHRYGVDEVSVKPQGAASFSEMSRSTDNTFRYTPGQQIQFPIALRLTDTNGAIVEDTIPTLQNDVITSGNAQFPPCNPILFIDGFETPK